MLEAIQLAAIVKTGGRTRLFRIPLHQRLQDQLAIGWEEQFEEFMDDVDEVEFDAGYTPEEHERFCLYDFELPDWLEGEDSQTIPQLDSISHNEDQLDSIKAIIAFAQARDEEVILFQNFTRSHVIRPGRFLFLNNKTYESRTRPGLTLDSKLAAVYTSQEPTLLFRSYRTTNTFLPLTRFYREVSEEEVRDILNHDRLAPEDVDAIAGQGNTQWFRKRFAMLRDSRILDEYTPEQILEHSQDYEVEIQLSDGRIVFPADKESSKRLLQYLNEELYRGAITETLYETNSKREAD